jgi:hypothetical protein
MYGGDVMFDRICDNKTIDLFLNVKLIKDDEVYYNLNRRSESFLYNFGAALFNVMFNRNLTCKDITGASFTPRASTAFVFYAGDGNTYIVLSNSSTDQTLSFSDYKINSPLTNLTVVSGYPQYTIDNQSNYISLIVSEKWTYTGSDTSITASALYYYAVFDTSNNGRRVMLAKDVFNPAITLQGNSLIEWSYIIKISL